MTSPLSLSATLRFARFSKGLCSHVFYKVLL
jgi:hypothetical protein